MAGESCPDYALRAEPSCAYPSEEQGATSIRSVRMPDVGASLRLLAPLEPARAQQVCGRLELAREEDRRIELVEVALAIEVQRLLVVLRHLQHQVCASPGAGGRSELLEQDGADAHAVIGRMHGDLLDKQWPHPALFEVAM